MKSFTVSTPSRTAFVNITSDVVRLVHESGKKNGLVIIYVPHTTCAITINEAADPDVVRDIQFQLDKIAPYEQGYHHREGNADAHIKTSLIGSSETVILDEGRLVLGTWQGIFLCEFDGPRTRKVYVKVFAC